MIKEITTDKKILGTKCEPCFFDSFGEMRNERIVQNLLDTANETKNCLGLSANQIGENKRIFLILTSKGFVPVINPQIIPIKTEGIKKNGRTVSFFS